MTKLLIHSVTEKHLNQLLRTPPQSLLLIGDYGVGLGAVAHYLGEKIAGKNNVIRILPNEKDTIKIDSIRSLHSQLRTKSAQSRVIIVDNADKMTLSSQNAFLKLLEEPPTKVTFILTSHSPQTLLSTVRSRVQQLTIQPISSEQTQKFIASKELIDTKKKAQVTFLANGLAAEITRLIDDSDYFEKRSHEMKQAREFISQGLYQKMIIIASLGNNRESALKLIQDSLNIVKLSLKSRPSKELTVLLQKLLQAEEKLHNDGHIKTQLLRLVAS